MTYPTARFLTDLGQRGHQTLLGKVRGTVRIDVRRERETDHWLVSIARGHLRVARDAGPADTVLRADQTCWDQLVSGEVNPLSAWLRNDLTVEGRFELLGMLERMLPPPPGARDPRDMVTIRAGGQSA